MSLTSLVLLALAQLPPSADPKPITVAGTVVDGSGAPVAVADVWMGEAIIPDDGRRSGMEVWWSATSRPEEGSTPVSDHIATDAAGRFTFRVPAEVVARRSPTPLVLWAAARGKDARLGWLRLPRIVSPDDRPVRIALGAPARTELTILGPDGKPAAGARVAPIRTGDLAIPARLASSLEATADAQGRAVIALGLEGLGAVRVEAAGFGEQTLEIRDSGFEIADIKLMLTPVARIAGKLVATNQEPIRGVTVRASTVVGGFAGSGQRGSATAACDDQGRFEIPAIAAGVLTLELKFDPKTSLTRRGEAPKHLIARAGRTTEVTIPLRETVKLRGLVREKGSHKPIPGVKVVLNGQLGGDHFAVSDAAGTFSGRIVREMTQPFGWAVRIPAPFYEPADVVMPRQNMPLREVGEFELNPLELARGVDVRGTVVGEDGKPVAGAEVEAIWTAAEGLAWSALARTDARGMFTLFGVDPLADMKVTAWDGFAGTPEVIVRPGDRPITLTISPKHTTPAAGRVVDPAGRPIAGASVWIVRQVRDRSGRVILVDPAASEDGSFVLKTDADGRYRTRRRLPAHASYFADAAAPGRLTARSPGIDLAAEATKPTVLVLPRVRTVEGRVIDRQGRPVAGARVRQSGDGPLPTEALTDDGRFRLSGVLEGLAFVFAEKEGFRFGFRPIDGDPGRAEIVLARTSEPPAASYRTLPPALPVEEEKALARRLIQPCLETILAKGKDLEKFRFFRDVIDVDPLGMLERLDSLKFSEADYLRILRVELAQSLARENLDEATALLEASDSAEVRAQGYAAICTLPRDLPPDRLREILAQAAVNARGVKSSQERIWYEATIADRWLDLGETERARALIDEALALGRGEAKGIKGGGYNLGVVAQALARIDLPAALKVLEDLERDARRNDKNDRSYVFERFFGQIAEKLADRSPADAERVLERIPIKQGGDRFVTAVCYRMAPKDLARARRIAEARISAEAPEYRPHVFGLMAQAIAAADRPAAIRLIDEAYAALDRIAASGESTSYPAADVGATLLPIVEQIEPDRLAECVAHTLALRPTQGDATAREGNATAWGTAALAMVLARYDRKLAARLLEPHVQKIGSHMLAFGTDNTTFRVLSALAVIDPKRAVERVEALPDDPAPGTDPEAAKNASRIAVAKILAAHGAERWRFVYENFLYLWTPDRRSL
jgi:protocatechuate 3,4-dioxygenase beta subunit